MIHSIVIMVEIRLFVVVLFALVTYVAAGKPTSSQCESFVTKSTKKINHLNATCKKYAACKPSKCTDKLCTVFYKTATQSRVIQNALHNQGATYFKLCGKKFKRPLSSFAKKIAANENFCDNAYTSSCVNTSITPCSACTTSCIALCNSCRFVGNCGSIYAPICLSCPGASPYCKCF